MKNDQNMSLNDNVITAIVTPDKDIIPGSNNLNLHILYLVIMKKF